MAELQRYALLAQRQDGTPVPPVCIYVTTNRAKAQADAERRETQRTHYWVVRYEEAFPDAR